MKIIAKKFGLYFKLAVSLQKQIITTQKINVMQKAQKISMTCKEMHLLLDTLEMKMDSNEKFLEVNSLYISQEDLDYIRQEDKMISKLYDKIFNKLD